MDKFEEMMMQMKDLPEEKRMEMMKDKAKMCTCPQCPSYNDCAKGKMELLYCAKGKSPECITKENGCICPTCPITPQMGLVKTFFCTRGSETEQRGM